ncbi:hypothetical protein F4703DRAFT_1892070 [Phycomyces blakesleeanus]
MGGPLPKTIPPLALVPFAMIQAHVFWFCSVVWLLYNNFSSSSSNTTLMIEPAYNKPKPKNKDTLPLQRTIKILEDKSNNTIHKKQRPRSFSEPPCNQIPITPLRPKRIQFNTSLSSLPETNADSDPGPRRPRQRRLFRVFSTHTQSQSHLHPQEQQSIIPENTMSSAVALMRPNRLDERIGKTCPPLWWQKTRLQIDMKKQSLPTEVPVLVLAPVHLHDNHENVIESAAARKSTDSAISVESGATLISSSPFPQPHSSPSPLPSPAILSRSARTASMLRSKFTPKSHQQQQQNTLSYQSADNAHHFVEPTQVTKKHRRATILGITRRFSRTAPKAATTTEEDPAETVSDRDQIDTAERSPRRKVFSRMSRWKKSKRLSFEQ